MNSFSLSENQAMLAESARKYVERGYDAKVRAASLAHPHALMPERWHEFAEMGWLALPLPEDAGGLGGSLADSCVLAEELGRGLVLEPWIACALMGAGLLAEAGSAAQRAHWLPALAAGERRVALAAWEPGGRFDATHVTCRAEPDGDGYRLHGVKEIVLGAAGADAVIVSAQINATDGRLAPGLFLVDAASLAGRLVPHALVDGSGAAQLRLDGVRVAADARLDGAPDSARALDRALDCAIVAHAAQTVGVMARALEITLEYLKTRKQFGRVIAGNQVIQHRLVDLYVAVEEGRALVRAAAHAFAGSDAERRLHASAARVHVAQAARLAWEEAVQLHGAIGMTDEYVLGAYVKTLALAHSLFGDAEQHLERMAVAEERLRPQA